MSEYWAPEEIINLLKQASRFLEHPEWHPPEKVEQVCEVIEKLHDSARQRRKASPWRNFRKSRPADGQYVHFRCEGEDETEQAWYIEEQRRIKGPMIDIYPDQLSWFLWQPYVEPAPPTASEIEAAMKGEE